MILSTSDRFHVALPDPGDPDLDGSDVFFSAGENEDIDVLDDNLVTENDKFDIDRACLGAGGTVDDEPDAEFQPDGNGVRQGITKVWKLPSRSSKSLMTWSEPCSGNGLMSFA